MSDFISTYINIEKEYIKESFFNFYCKNIWKTIKHLFKSEDLIIDKDIFETFTEAFFIDDYKEQTNDIFEELNRDNFNLFRLLVECEKSGKLNEYLKEKNKGNLFLNTNHNKDNIKELNKQFNSDSIENLIDIFQEYEADLFNNKFIKIYINNFSENILEFRKKIINLILFNEKFLENKKIKLNFKDKIKKKFIKDETELLFKYNDYKYLEDLLIKKSRNIFERNLREITIDILRNQIEEYNILKNQENDSKEFQYYPIYDEKDFNNIIYNKKEFNQHKVLKLENNNNLKNRFVKTPTQNFLENFVSLETPYNGIFLWHGVGSGKTCSAITIAENFIKYLQNINKKILIVLPTDTLTVNWMDEIFNLDKELNKTDEYNVQCTGEKYTQYVKSFNKNIYTEKYLLKKDSVVLKNIYKKLLNRELTIAETLLSKEEVIKLVIESNKEKEKEKLSRKIKKYILETYEITTITKLTNSFDKKSKNYNESQKIAYIKKVYSNRIIIFDEIHTSRDLTEKKKSSNFLEMLVRYGELNKLILLSATPMYDKPSEILKILNLLLLNDKRAPLEEEDIFINTEKPDIESEIIELIKHDGLLDLKKKTTGYISYVRGQNPFTYPIKLWPLEENCLTLDDTAFIFEDDNENMKNNIKFYKNILLKEQTNQYNKQKKQKQRQQNINITYPRGNQFKRIFQQTGEKYIITSEDSAIKNMFKEENIQNYSAKIYNIVQELKGSQGISFVYSQFVDTGAGTLPLAFVLEEIGFDRYNLNNNSDNNNLFIDKNNRDENDRYCSIFKKKYSDLTSLEKNKFKQAHYIYLTGNEQSDNINKLIKKVRSEENKNGEEISVILGSDTISTGFSFFNIRQIHIMEPWWNFSKLEQIIGRGMRNLSHKNLPENQRNVIIYLHVGISDEIDDIDNIDLKMYKVSYKKKKEISKLQKALKEISVDCALNYNSNFFIDDIYLEKKKQIDSKNQERNVSNKDNDFSFECDLEKCESKEMLCKFKVMPENTDTILYTKNNLNLNETLKKKIKFLFSKSNFYKLDELEKELNLTEDDEKIQFYLVLNEMIIKKYNFKIPIQILGESEIKNFNRDGYIIFKDEYYIFQPNYKSILDGIIDENLPISYRLLLNKEEKNLDTLINNIQDYSDKDLKILDKSSESDIIIDTKKKIKTTATTTTTTSSKTIKDTDNLSVDQIKDIIFNEEFDLRDDNCDDNKQGRFYDFKCFFLKEVKSHFQYFKEKKGTIWNIPYHEKMLELVRAQMIIERLNFEERNDFFKEIITQIFIKEKDDDYNKYKIHKTETLGEGNANYNNFQNYISDDRFYEPIEKLILFLYDKNVNNEHTFLILRNKRDFNIDYYSDYKPCIFRLYNDNVNKNNFNFFNNDNKKFSLRRPTRQGLVAYSKPELPKFEKILHINRNTTTDIGWYGIGESARSKPTYDFYVKNQANIKQSKDKRTKTQGKTCSTNAALSQNMEEINNFMSKFPESKISEQNEFITTKLSKDSLCQIKEILFRLRQLFRTDEDIKKNFYYFFNNYK